MGKVIEFPRKAVTELVKESSSTNSENRHLSQNGDFGERMKRIKQSLERINVLISELKKSTRKPTEIEE